MKKRLIKFRDLMVTLAGGRPEVVGPLATGLTNAAKGISEVLHERSRRKRGIHFSPDTVRILVLVLAALGSVVFSLVMVLSPSDLHPSPGVVVLVMAHWAVVSLMVMSMAGPSLLVDDDAKVIGWWPISSRELLLARLHLVLQPALEITLAMSLLPVIVYIFTGTPPLLAAISLLVGLFVQAVNVSFSVVVLVSLALRFVGRRKSVRMASFVADGNLMYLYYPLLFLGDELAAWVMVHKWSLVLLPSTWFIAAGDLQVGPYYHALAAGGFLVTLVMIGLGLRLLVSGNIEAEAEVAEKRPSPWHWSRVISTALSPFMRNVEGWTLRLLLEQHLREDWRFIGSWSTSFLMITMMTFFRDGGREVLSSDLVFSSLTTVSGAVFIIVFAATFIFSMSYSGQWKAMWLVALADLDANRMLAAQRHVLRMLYTVPAVGLFTLKAGLLGAPWFVLVRDSLILGLEIEIIMMLIQSYHTAMPFGAAFQQDKSARRLLLGFMMMGFVAVAALLNYSYTHHWVSAYVIWLVLPAFWYAANLLVRRRCHLGRLEMDVVLDV